MSDTWKPITEAKLVLRIEEELESMSPDERQNFARLRAPVGNRGRLTISGTGAIEAFFIVARNGTRIVFFDDIEGDFGAGTIDEKGFVSEASLFGDLRWALRTIDTA